MDDKYILEFGKMTNSIENLIKNQDKHYIDLRNMISEQKEASNLNIHSLKSEIKAMEKDRELFEEKTTKRIEDVERFDIKILTYCSAISVGCFVFFKVLPFIEIAIVK